MNKNFNFEEEKLPVHLSIDDLENDISVGYYEGEQNRTTIDNEWSEEDLKSDVDDEVLKFMSPDNKNSYYNRNKSRPVYNKDLTHEEFVAEKIKSENDLVEIYNKEYDKHHSDSKQVFTIHYFDEWLQSEIKRIIDENIVK